MGQTSMRLPTDPPPVQPTPAIQMEGHPPSLLLSRPRRRPTRPLHPQSHRQTSMRLPTDPPPVPPTRAVHSEGHPPSLLLLPHRLQKLPAILRAKLPAHLILHLTARAKLPAHLFLHLTARAKLPALFRAGLPLNLHLNL